MTYNFVKNSILPYLMKIVDAGCMKCPSDFLFGHDFFPGKHTVKSSPLLPSYQRALKTETDLRI